MTAVAILISVFSSIVSGTVLFFLKRYFNNKAKLEEELHKSKQKENVLILKSIDAIGKLTYANAIAIRDGKTNGEMHTAINSYHKVDNELYNFLLEENSKK